MRISDWSSDVCSSDLHGFGRLDRIGRALEGGEFADEVQDRGHIVGCGGADRQRHGTIGSASAKARGLRRSEEHTSELQSIMRNSYAVFCLKKKKKKKTTLI